MKVRGFTPAPEAAFRAGITREKIVSAIQKRQIAGMLYNGRWHVEDAEVERLEAERRGPGADLDLPKQLMT